MITLLLSFLLILTFLFFIGRQTKTGNAFLISTFLLFLMTGTGIILSWCLHDLESFPIQINPVWKKNNAIVLLGAGTVKSKDALSAQPTLLAYSRIYETARLYLLCKKTKAQCKIIISGGDALSTGESEASTYQTALNNLGIENTNIILEKNSMNTYQNAAFTSPILKRAKVDAVFLVTSGIHMKRALLYFSNFGINPMPAVSDSIPSHITLIPLGYNFALTDFVLHEYAGIARFYVYNYLGLNKHST